MHLDTASAYTRGWANSQVRAKATPISYDFCLGFTAYWLLNSRPRAALSILLGFTALLRSDEVVTVRPSMITHVLSESAICISFKKSKGAKRKGQPELIVVKHLHTVTLLRWLLSRLNDDEPIFEGSWRDLRTCICDAAANDSGSWQRTRF